MGELPLLEEMYREHFFSKKKKQQQISPRGLVQQHFSPSEIRAKEILDPSFSLGRGGGGRCWKFNWEKMKAVQSYVSNILTLVRNLPSARMTEASKTEFNVPTLFHMFKALLDQTANAEYSVY